MKNNGKKHMIIGLCVAIVLVIILIFAFKGYLAPDEDGININSFSGSMSYEEAKPYLEITAENYEKEYGNTAGLERNFELPQEYEIKNHLYNLEKDEKGNYTILVNEEYVLESEDGEAVELRFSREKMPYRQNVVYTCGEKLSKVNGAVADIHGDTEKKIFSALIQKHNDFYFVIHAYDISEERFLDFIDVITK